MWGGWGSNPRPADYEKYGHAPSPLAAQTTRIIALTAFTALGLSEAPVHEPVHGRGTYSSHPVTVRNFAEVRAYARDERRRGLPRLDMRVECDAPNALNMRGRQRLGEWYQ